MKLKKFLISILIILIFFSFTDTAQASIFSHGEEDKKSEIEETIDKDEGGLFEKIIAKMIGGLAQTVFDVTTSETFGVRF